MTPGAAAAPSSDDLARGVVPPADRRRDARPLGLASAVVPDDDDVDDVAVEDREGGSHDALPTALPARLAPESAGPPYRWNARRACGVPACCLVVVVPAALSFHPALFALPVLAAGSAYAAYRATRALAKWRLRVLSERRGLVATATVLRRRTWTEELASPPDQYEVDVCFLARGGDILVVKRGLAVTAAVYDAAAISVRYWLLLLDDDDDAEEEEEPDRLGGRIVVLRVDCVGVPASVVSSSSSTSSPWCRRLGLSPVVALAVVAATAVTSWAAGQTFAVVQCVVCLWWLAFVASCVALLGLAARPSSPTTVRLFDLRVPDTAVMRRRHADDRTEDASCCDAHVLVLGGMPASSSKGDESAGEAHRGGRPKETLPGGVPDPDDEERGALLLEYVAPDPSSSASKKKEDRSEVVWLVTVVPEAGIF